MSEIEIIKLIFGILLSLGGIILIFIAFKRFYKYLIQEKRCTQKVKGTVYGYTLTSKGEGGVFLPKVKYNVSGKEYKVIGPEYRGYLYKMVNSPLNENEEGNYYEDEKQRFVIERKVNSMVRMDKPPMAKLYPIGSEQDVFYYDKNPKVAFVKRYCNLKWGFWLTFIAGISVLIIDLLILFLL